MGATVTCVECLHERIPNTPSVRGTCLTVLDPAPQTPHRSLFQQHAGLGVHRRGLRVRQPEGARVELVDMLREASKADVRAARRSVRGIAAAESVAKLGVKVQSMPMLLPPTVDC